MCIEVTGQCQVSAQLLSALLFKDTVSHLTQSSHIGWASWLTRSGDPAVFAYTPLRATVTGVKYHTRFYVDAGGS